MSELINKFKSWYESLRTSKVSFEKKGINPKKDWNRILIVTFVTVSLLAGLSFYFYVEVDNGTFFSVEGEEESAEIKINNVLLKKIVEDINNREKSLMEIKEGKSVPANPSI